MPETATFDHYEVLTRDDGSLYELGRGAMGVTYKAFDKSLQYPVCLKVINADYLKSDVVRQRFIREARSAAKLRHRNVASVFHLGIEGDRWYYAMEFIDGETLETIIRQEGALAPREALEITAQVARALNAAAQRGLVHRDIKPANLMLIQEDGEVLAKVIDFGLVKGSMEGEDDATLSVGGFIGTAQFASPEQLEDREIDVRSDIYSLGVTLWDMLAGQPPFRGSVAQVMNQQLSKPPPFHELAGLPPEVIGLLRKMLEKNPADRFQTPLELRKATGEILDKLPAIPALEAPASTRGPKSETPAVIEETQFDTGSIIAGRYCIIEFLGETNAGRVYRAEESAEVRDVRLVVLHDLQAGAGMAREIERLRETRHPNLLEVFDFGATGSSSFLAMEWTNGFSLLELLRARRELSADEAILLLKQAASGIDCALGRGLAELEFGLHQILLDFGEPFKKEAILRQPLRQWPEFTLKLQALGLTPDFGSSQTWAGQTLAPGASPSAPDEPDTRGRYIRALAMVAYELLGGTISPLMHAIGGIAKPAYTPLAALSEKGNETLKSALYLLHPFKGAQEFCDALTQSAIRASPRLPLAPAPPRSGVGRKDPVGEPARPTRLEPAPPRSDIGRKDPVDEPVRPTRLEPAPPRADIGRKDPVGEPARPIRLEPAPPRADIMRKDPVAEPPPPIPAEPALPPLAMVRNDPVVDSPPPIPSEPASRRSTFVSKEPVAEPPPPVPAKPAPPPPPTLVRKQLVGDSPRPVSTDLAPPHRAASDLRKNLKAALMVSAAVGTLVICVEAYFLLKRSGGSRVAEAPTPGPNLKGSLARTQEFTPVPGPTPVPAPTPVTLATPVPLPPIDKLAVAVRAAGILEEHGSYRAALAGYLKIMKDFPDTGLVPGRNHLETLLERLRTTEPIITPDQFESMRDLIEEAGRGKVLSAMVLLGQELKVKAPAESFQWYKKAADAGDPAACGYVGNTLSDGDPGVVAKDLKQAMVYLQRGADAGNVRSKAALGQFYVDGLAGIKDEDLGIRLLREAVAAKNPRAMNYLGDYLAKKAKRRPSRERKTAAAEYAEAFGLFTESKDLGDLKALTNLGILYMEGVAPGAHGPEYAKGVALFAQGAKFSDPLAMLSYARCLESGIGIKKDPIEAKRWEIKAAKAADKDFIQWSNEHNISLPNKLTP